MFILVFIRTTKLVIEQSNIVAQLRRVNHIRPTYLTFRRMPRMPIRYFGKLKIIVQQLLQAYPCEEISFTKSTLANLGPLYKDSSHQSRASCWAHASTSHTFLYHPKCPKLFLRFSKGPQEFIDRDWAMDMRTFSSRYAALLWELSTPQTDFNRWIESGIVSST